MFEIWVLRACLGYHIVYVYACISVCVCVCVCGVCYVRSVGNGSQISLWRLEWRLVSTLSVAARTEGEQFLTGSLDRGMENYVRVEIVVNYKCVVWWLKVCPSVCTGSSCKAVLVELFNGFLWELVLLWFIQKELQFGGLVNNNSISLLEERYLPFHSFHNSSIYLIIAGFEFLSFVTRLV